MSFQDIKIPSASADHCPPGQGHDPDPPNRCVPLPVPPPGAQPIRFRVLGIEVTQAIQDMTHTVPLIAGKRTIARVYLSIESGGPFTQLQLVTGELSMFRPGDPQTLPLPGRTIAALDSARVDTTTDLVSKRLDIRRSIEFELPPAWTGVGSIHLQFKPVIQDVQPGVIFEEQCSNCNTALTPAFIRFQESPSLTINLVNIQYRSGGRQFFEVSNSLDIGMLKSWLGRAYPVGNGRITFNHQTMLWGEGIPTCQAFILRMNAAYYALIALTGGDIPIITRSLTLGIINDQGLRAAGVPIAGGCAVPGIAGAPPMGATHVGSTSGTSLTWDTDGSYADWVGAHELGHELVRFHPNFRDPMCRNPLPPLEPKDARYPHAGGFIGGSDQLLIGFDVGGSFLVREGFALPPTRSNTIIISPASGGSDLVTMPMRVYPPTTFSDLMTYNCRIWISDYTYGGILESIRTGAYISVRPGHPILPTSANPNGNNQNNMSVSGGIPDNNTANIPTPSPSNKTLLIRGEFYEDSIQLLPFLTLPGSNTLVPLPNESKYSIELLDEQGNTLARYLFSPTPLVEIDEPVTALINQIIPYHEGTKEIVVLEDDRELGSRIVSDNAPIISNVNVSRNDTNGRMNQQSDTITVSWHATDSDGDILTFVVLYSPDGGSAWHPISADIKESQLSIDQDTLPGGDDALFRVIATDGANTAIGDSDDAFIVPNKPPMVNIISPFENSAFFTTESSETTTIALYGDAQDLEDGSLDESALVWSDSEQGVLGQGRSINVDGLMPGKHTITLTAKDNDGEGSSASINISMLSN